jgi:hypothetical protein
MSFIVLPSLLIVPLLHLPQYLPGITADRLADGGELNGELEA